MGVNTRDMEEAIGFLRVALAARPEDPNLLGWLGGMLLDVGRDDEALAVCQQVFQVLQNNPGPYLSLGWALQRKRNPHLDGAVRAYRKAIEIDQKSVSAEIGLAFALRSKGDLEDAAAADRKAIEIDRSDAAKLYEGLGGRLERRSDLDKAIAVYRRAIEIAPNAPMAALYTSTRPWPAPCGRRASRTRPSLTAARPSKELSRARPGGSTLCSECASRSKANMTAPSSPAARPRNSIPRIPAPISSWPRPCRRRAS